MSRASRVPRAVMRFLSAVLVTAGILMLTDAGVTLAWQEPISAFITARQQDALQEDLEAAARDARLARGALATRAERWVSATDRGDALGRIELPTLRRSYVFVEGTDTGSLRKGPGHYTDTPMPGQRGTVGIAGHRTTYMAPFRTIDKLKPGDRIVLKMPYATLTYRMERIRIVGPSALWVKRPVGYDRLVLSACHPKYSAARRIVAFARFVDARPA